MAPPSTPYRGRFAPSPTGPLHLGSLIAALASYLDAHSKGGQWLVRMEDLDPPREAPGAAQSILESLQTHGLVWDEDVMWQSQRIDAYEKALNTLISKGHIFACNCTRTALGPTGACDGRCRSLANPEPPCSLRVAVPRQWSVTLEDRLQGRKVWQLGQQLPDFILRRKDQLFAYQLAVVVDDADQKITHIVRGSDLLDSTPRQLFLQQLLNCPPISYCHIPVLTNNQGQKLSKQNHAPALSNSDALGNLSTALRFLNQKIPPQEVNSCDALLKFAVHNWQPARIAVCNGIPASALSPHS